jgi:hypothetical protein
MKTFWFTAVIAVFLFSLCVGIQAQNKPTFESAINPRMDLKRLQGASMPSMGHAFDENEGFKDNELHIKQ